MEDQDIFPLRIIFVLAIQNIIKMTLNAFHVKGCARNVASHRLTVLRVLIKKDLLK
jgi:hypothetical protein